MFIGHIPAGYLATKAILKLTKADQSALSGKWLMLLGLVAAIAPDLDLVYFYLIDSRQTLHHEYFTHAPYFWVYIFCFTTIIALMSGSRVVHTGSLIIFCNTMIHMLLDTIVGKIRWAWPFSSQDTVFFDVPSVYDWWVLNFILHWTFLFECIVFIYAAYIYILNKRSTAAIFFKNNHRIIQPSRLP